MKFLLSRMLALLGLCTASGSVPLFAHQECLRSLDGKVIVEVDDKDGVRYRVSLYGQPVLSWSKLGLGLKEGTQIGCAATLQGASWTEHQGVWENPFGQRRKEPDSYREMKIGLVEKINGENLLNLIFRAYDNGVAFRYELGPGWGPASLIIDDEFTEFRFPSNWPCWAGDHSDCAESQYPQKQLLDLSPDRDNAHVLPLLVKLPQGYAAIAESDLLDWAGMFLNAASKPEMGPNLPGAKVTLAKRADANGCVVTSPYAKSPWRVILLARDAAGLVSNSLVSSLASPSKIQDVSWIKPGVAAWDSWWTGLNPTQPEFRGLRSRGDTRSHKEYIDFAAEMGFPYQLIDWYWYEPMNDPAADLTKPSSHVDIPGLVAYAKDRHVRLILWIDSRDLARQGVDLVLDQVATWGFGGVKIDFMNSDSQETVDWYQKVLSSAAKRRLLVDFHGAYKPTGLSRTWPNFITQEGVLGNEYNKIRVGACTAKHTITLPFTRGLLGPMDFTPGGFLNRTAASFKVAEPAEVVGTRARQLAASVIYFSPLLCLCDSPENYRGQPGVEFLRGLPTVWDETIVIAAEVAEHLVIARRHGTSWYLAAMNSEAPITLRISLKFLGSGSWNMRTYSDASDSASRPEALEESARRVTAADVSDLTLAPAGGYTAVFTLGSR